MKTMRTQSLCGPLSVEKEGARYGGRGRRGGGGGEEDSEVEHLPEIKTRSNSLNAFCASNAKSGKNP